MRREVRDDGGREEPPLTGGKDWYLGSSSRTRSRRRGVNRCPAGAGGTREQYVRESTGVASHRRAGPIAIDRLRGLAHPAGRHEPTRTTLVRTMAPRSGRSRPAMIARRDVNERTADQLRETARENAVYTKLERGVRGRPGRPEGATDSTEESQPATRELRERTRTRMERVLGGAVLVRKAAYCAVLCHETVKRQHGLPAASTATPKTAPPNGIQGRQAK